MSYLIEKKCKVPFGFIEIFPNGNVFTCCPAYIKNGCIGNIFKEPFLDIINSNRAIEIRKNILNHDYSMCNLDLCYPNETPFASQLDSKYIENIQYTTFIDKVNIIKFSHDLNCNIQCKSCRDKIINNSNEEIKALDEKAEKYFMPILKYTDKVCFSGSGDPLSSKHTRNFIKKISNTYSNIKFDLHTNGLLLNERILNDICILDKLSNIQISVHASKKEIYDKIISGGNFDLLIKNLDFIYKLKKENKIEKIHLYFVIQKSNAKDIVNFIKFAEKYEAEVYFWNMRNFGTEHSENEIANENLISRILKNKTIDKKFVHLNPYLLSLKTKNINEKNEINICMYLGNGDSKYIITSIISILENSKDNEIINMHFLDGGINQKNKEIIINTIKKYNANIKFYKPNIDKYTTWFNKNYNSNDEKDFTYWSQEVLYKLSIPSIMPDIEKILYIDANTIIKKSLYELYNINIDNYYIAAVEATGSELVDELKQKFHLNKYFNSSILLINNKKFIEDKLEEKFNNFFDNNYDKIISLDQDILNVVCNGKVKYIDYKYNFTPYAEKLLDIKDVVIIHYRANKIKPFNNYIYPNLEKYVEEFWKYFCLTPWFQENPSEYINIMINQKINIALEKRNYDLSLNQLNDKNIKNSNKLELLEKEIINKSEALEKQIQNIINKLVWFIPIKSVRNKIRNDILRPDH